MPILALSPSQPIAPLSTDTHSLRIRCLLSYFRRLEPIWYIVRQNPVPIAIGFVVL